MLDIAILDGVRTPFVKVFGPLASVPAVELGRLATTALLQRAALRPDQIDQVILGNAATPPDAANIARIVALKSGIPAERIAHTVHRNCASGMEAITEAANLVQLGQARRLLAGGVESMSQVPMLFSGEATEFFLGLARARGWWARLRAAARFRPRFIKPVPALKLGLTDPVSGLLMGETAEVLADEFGISRRTQDEYALQSHRRAVDAQLRCVLSEEIAPVPAEVAGSEVKQDVGPRADQSLEALAKLAPYFRENGTVTVGNSCSVTDGAALVLVMAGAEARAEGRTPLGYLRGFAYAGLDPRRMGLGPVYATSKLLQQTGLSLHDIDLIELNEAFAAQVLACEKAFASTTFAREHLDRRDALGILDPDRVNVHGGAIALGHPIGATGARLVLTLLKELRRRKKRFGLATLCVGGGQGAALLLECGA